MANLGSLMYQVGADTSSLRKAEADVKRSTGVMEKSFLSLGTVIKGVGFAYVSNEAVQFAKNTIEVGMRMQQLSLSMKAITGSTAGAANEISFIRQESARLGAEFMSTADAYKGIAAAAKGTSLEGKGVRDIFTAVTEAATVLGLSSEQTGRSLYALSQMISKGKVASEELRLQLGESLPGAFQVAARSMGMTTQEFDKFVSEGKVMTDDFLPKFARALHEQYGGSVGDSANSARAASNRLKNAWTELADEIWKQNESAYTNFLNWMTQVVGGMSDIISKGPKASAALRSLAEVELPNAPEVSSANWSNFWNWFTSKPGEYQPTQPNIPEVPWAVPAGQTALKSSREARRQTEAVSTYGLSPYQINPEVVRDIYMKGAEAFPKQILGGEGVAGAGYKGKAQKYYQKYAVTGLQEQLALENDIKTTMTAEGYAQESITKAVKKSREEFEKKEKSAKGTALSVADIDQYTRGMASAAAQSTMAFEKMSYEMLQIQRIGEGRQNEVEWLKLEVEQLRSMEEAWKDIADAQNKYDELMQKLTKEHKGGVSPEATAEGAAAKQYLDQVWSTGFNRMNLIPQMTTAKWEQYIRSSAISSKLRSAQLQQEYYTTMPKDASDMWAEMTGGITKAKQAQLDYIEAVRVKNVEESKGNQELITWYNKVAEAQTYAILKTGEMTQFAVQAARNIQDALGDNLYNILKGNFDDIGTAFGDMILKMIAQASAAQLSKWLFGDFGNSGSIGGVTGLALDWFGELFKAEGGPVRGGQSYVVGERGPEIFTPSGAGYITPNSSLSGGSSAPILNVTVVPPPGTRVEASQTQPRFDGKAYHASISLQLLKNDEGYRDSVRGMILGRS